MITLPSIDNFPSHVTDLLNTDKSGLSFNIIYCNGYTKLLYSTRLIASLIQTSFPEDMYLTQHHSPIDNTSIILRYYDKVFRIYDRMIKSLNDNAAMKEYILPPSYNYYHQIFGILLLHETITHSSSYGNIVSPNTNHEKIILQLLIKFRNEIVIYHRSLIQLFTTIEQYVINHNMHYPYNDNEFRTFLPQIDFYADILSIGESVFDLVCEKLNFVGHLPTNYLYTLRFVNRSLATYIQQVSCILDNRFCVYRIFIDADDEMFEKSIFRPKDVKTADEINIVDYIKETTYLSFDVRLGINFAVYGISEIAMYQHYKSIDVNEQYYLNDPYPGEYNIIPYIVVDLTNYIYNDKYDGDLVFAYDYVGKQNIRFVDVENDLTRTKTFDSMSTDVSRDVSRDMSMTSDGMFSSTSFHQFADK